MARFEREYTENIYKNYISDALHAIGQLNIRYSEIVDKSKIKHTSESSEEIIGRIRQKLQAMSED